MRPMSCPSLPTGARLNGICGGDHSAQPLSLSVLLYLFLFRTPAGVAGVAQCHSKGRLSAFSFICLADCTGRIGGLSGRAAGRGPGCRRVVAAGKRCCDRHVSEWRLRGLPAGAGSREGSRNHGGARRRHPLTPSDGVVVRCRF